MILKPGGRLENCVEEIFTNTDAQFYRMAIKLHFL